MPNVRPILVAALACVPLIACSTTELSVEGTPLTAEEIEYQRQLENSDHRQLDAAGKSDLLLKLDQNLRNWHRGRIGQVSPEDQRMVENLEQILHRSVYLNFDVVLDFLENGAPPQRAIAAAAIGFSRLDEPRDEEQRRTFLAKWPQLYPRAISPLLAQLDATEPYLVQNVLLGLWKLGEPKTPLDPILPLVDSSDTETRALAVLALSTILTPDTGELAISALMNAMHDQDPKVRNHAVTAVGNIRHPNSAGRLAQLLNDPYLLIQANAARSLAKLGDPTNIGFLLVRLETLQRGRPEESIRRVTGMEQRRQVVSRNLVSSLERLSGEDFGTDAEKWRSWWDDEGKAKATG